MKYALLSVLLLTGCAHGPAGNDLAIGRLGSAVWKDCAINPKTAIIKCKCQEFTVSVDAKTGNNIINCAQGE